jgi:hypothetical protein
LDKPFGPAGQGVVVGIARNLLLRGVPEDVVVEIGEGEKDNMGIGLAVR